MISTLQSGMKSGKGALNVHLDTATGLLKANATLPHEAQKQYDSAMLKIARARLTISEFLRSRGLTRSLGGLGTILSLYERSGDFNAANVSMSGRTRGDQDILTFDQVGVPIPIFHKEFEVDERALQASRTTNTPLDTTSIEIATRRIADLWESHIFYGAPQIVVGGNTVYGLCSHPDRNTSGISTAWDDAGKTGAQIITDVNAMINQLRGDKMYGPYVLVVNNDYWVKITEDYSSSKGDMTIKQRIEAHPNIEAVLEGNHLNNDEVVMFQATSETVDLAIAQDMTNLPWSSEPLSKEIKVFMAGAVRVKSDKAGNCGVAHWTES